MLYKEAPRTDGLRVDFGSWSGCVIKCDGLLQSQGGSIEMERRRRKKRPAVWELVTDNLYTHRKRKV